MPEYKARWLFGDGTESTERNPTHIYKMAGEYDVLLIKEFESGISTRNTFVIYVYEWQIGERLHVVYTNKSIRDATIPMQGVGMTEYGGDNFLWPEAYVGACNGYHKNNEVVSIVLDTFSGHHYRIGIPEQWLDKLDNLGYTKGAGYEIMCRWKQKEYVSSGGEYEDVRHVETHAYLRPFWEEDRSKEGHNPDTGYRIDFALTARLFQDGELGFETEAKNIPRLADIVFPKEVKGPRFLTEFETNTSSFRCVGVQQQVEEDSKKRGPEYNTKSEVLWAREFSRPNFWVSRNSVTPLINRVDGIEVDGSFDSLVTGPDSTPNSALSFGASDGLSFDLSSLGEHTLLWWVNQIIADTDIWVFGTRRISLEFIDNQYNLVLNNGIQTTNIPIGYQGETWALLIVKFMGNQIRVFRDKEDFGIRNFNFGDYSGNATFMNNEIGEAFDIRRVPRKISSEALNNYYDCVVRDRGKTGYLPNMR